MLISEVSKMILLWLPHNSLINDVALKIYVATLTNSFIKIRKTSLGFVAFKCYNPIKLLSLLLLVLCDFK